MATDSSRALRVYRRIRDHRTLGERAADWIAKWVGSWAFLFALSLFLGLWVLFNVYFVFFRAWDPYPFILLNLVLSTIAAYQAPIILMSQNRAAEIDRRRFEYDYAVNRKAEREVADMQKDLEEIKKLIKQLKRSYSK